MLASVVGKFHHVGGGTEQYISLSITILSANGIGIWVWSAQLIQYGDWKSYDHDGPWIGIGSSMVCKDLDSKITLTVLSQWKLASMLYWLL